MGSAAITVTIKQSLAIVTIDNPPVNASSHAVRSGLAQAVRQTNENQTLQAVILTCAGATFVAGADIKEFGKPPATPILSDVVSQIERARIPWVAVLHGSVFGGGLELALGCRFRIADTKTMLGFPEVKLGLIPGAGGTVRLPRIIAMQDALKLITSGNPVDATTAKNNGLVDEIISHPQNLLESAELFITSNAFSSQRLPLIQSPVIEPLSHEQLQQSLTTFSNKRQFAAAEATEALRRSIELPAEEALLQEQQAFQKLRDSDQSKALRYLFFAERTVSRVPELKAVNSRTIEEVGVVGGGTMGTGIATSALLNGFKVIMIEKNDASIKSAVIKVESNLTAACDRGIITAEEQSSALKRFGTSTGYTALKDSDLVIEAVFEDMSVKTEVFHELDKVTKPAAILASNTSYLDISGIANLVKDPSRVVGLHYFSPAHIMKLLEVIRTEAVAPDVLASAIKFAKQTGKIAVPAGDCKGFIGNRIMSAYRRTAEYLIEDGALPFEVDSAMKNYGFPMGIFEMQDLAGLDIGWAMRTQLSAEEKSASRYVDIADKLCEAERFGRKTGSGYYQYSDGKTAERDAWVEQLIESESTRKNIVRRSFTEVEIMSQILEQINTEGKAIVKEGFAASAEAIDVVMVNGYGFPRWRGGPMFAATTD